MVSISCNQLIYLLYRSFICSNLVTTAHALTATWFVCHRDIQTRLPELLHGEQFVWKAEAQPPSGVSKQDWILSLFSPVWFELPLEWID